LVDHFERSVILIALIAAIKKLVAR